MTLERENSTSIEYDAAFVQNVYLKSFTPEPHYDVSLWADKYRLLSGKSSAEPGEWKTSRTPYLKEIMDQLSTSSPAQRIVFMKGAQVGGTEAGNNWIGYIVHMAPGPMMAVSPTVELAKRNSKQRIEPLLQETPELRERVKPARERDSGNTILSKEFDGGLLIMTGANSAAGLRSMPARYPPGSCHFPQYGEEYFKQLTAERCITRVVRGFPKQVWEKDPSRNNEALDCRVYARAAASIYGLDRMSDYKWRALEKSLGQEVIIPTKGVEMPVPAISQQAQAGKTTQKPKRKPRVPQRKVIKADDPYL